MATYRVGTITTLYCKDSMALLSELLRYARQQRVIITYGDNAIFEPLPDKRFKVINISRHGAEYKGFINFYRKVSD